VKQVIFLLFITIYVGCKSTTTDVQVSDENQVTMKTIEKWTFFDPEEKLKFIFTPQNGGQIISLSWEGVKVAEKFVESYPNKESDIKQLKPRIMDDGEDLVIVYSTVRGKFQLIRSYRLRYLKETQEHIVEVIYNVKNYSSDTPINQQWIQELSLPESINLDISQKEASGKVNNSSFTISAINVSNLEIIQEKGILKIANDKNFTLSPKEKLSWKVLYKLKNN